jgi:hypothetical protein
MNEAIVPSNATREEFAAWDKANGMALLIGELHRCHKTLSDRGGMETYYYMMAVRQVSDDLNDIAYKLKEMTRNWRRPDGDEGFGV